jgi:hypothetical protein
MTDEITLAARAWHMLHTTLPPYANSPFVDAFVAGSEWQQNYYKTALIEEGDEMQIPEEDIENLLRSSKDFGWNKKTFATYLLRAWRIIDRARGEKYDEQRKYAELLEAAYACLEHVGNHETVDRQHRMEVLDKRHRLRLALGALGKKV